MDKTVQVVERLQTGLEPFVKHREHVNYIRRVLALELGSCTSGGLLQRPIALPQGQNDYYIDESAVKRLKGVHKEYVEALRANIGARQKFDSLQYGHRSGINASTIDASNKSTSLLDDHNAILNLRQKLLNLEIIQGILVQLSGKPAADGGFLGQELSLASPTLPMGTMDGSPVTMSNENRGLSDQLKQLERSVLRQKLLLKKEEKHLFQARARCTMKPSLVSHGAKLQALDATRDALISWIENELGKTSGDNVEAGDPGGNNFSSEENGTVSQQLQIIQRKYTAYVCARKDLLSVVSQDVQPPAVTPQTHSPAAAQTTQQLHRRNSDHLLVSYADELVSQWRKQDTFVLEKSHIASFLCNRNRQISESLVRLADQSQLLQSYPMKDSSRRRSAIPQTTSASVSSRPESASRIKPWVFAADAAKIAMLENVTEKVECGQVALETSMRALAETDALLGQDGQGRGGDGGGQQNDTTSSGRQQYVSPRKRVQIQDQAMTDPWAQIHGNLGLIGNG